MIFNIVQKVLQNRARKRQAFEQQILESKTRVKAHLDAIQVEIEDNYYGNRLQYNQLMFDLTDRGKSDIRFQYREPKQYERWDDCCSCC